MLNDVTGVAHVRDNILELEFENGERGVVDLKHYIAKGGVFKRFSDPDYFKSVTVNKGVGTICWLDGGDIAPETLYDLAVGSHATGTTH